MYFETLITKLRQRFYAGKIEEKHFRYIGSTINQTGNGVILDQSEYINKLECPILGPQRLANKDDIVTPDEQTNYRQLVGQINWVAQGFYYRHVIKEILGVTPKTIPVTAYTDNRSVIEAVYSTKMVDDKGLRVDIAVIRESLETNIVSMK